jgi:hypothetical protein
LATCNAGKAAEKNHLRVEPSKNIRGWERGRDDVNQKDRFVDVSACFIDNIDPRGHGAAAYEILTNKTVLITGNIEREAALLSL